MAQANHQEAEMLPTLSTIRMGEKVSDDHLGAVSDDDRPPCCEVCGKPTEELKEEPDCDPSVGYHGSVLVCPACRETAPKNKCGSCG